MEPFLARTYTKVNRNINLTSLHRVVVLLLLLTKDTACECDAPAVQEGHTANLTFKFNIDVSRFQRDFRVDHYGFDNNGGSVLDCHWYNKNTLECQKRPGFSYHENVTNMLIVHIDNTSQQHMGTYKYSMRLPDQLYEINCKLNVTVTDAEITTTTLLPQKNASHMDLSPVYIPLIVLCVMALVIALVYYYICRCKQFQCRRSDPQETRSKKRDLKCWKRGNNKEKRDYWLKNKRPSSSNAEDVPVEMKETDASECLNKDLPVEMKETDALECLNKDPPNV